MPTSGDLAADQFPGSSFSFQYLLHIRIIYIFAGFYSRAYHVTNIQKADLSGKKSRNRLLISRIIDGRKYTSCPAYLYCQRQSLKCLRIRLIKIK